MRTPSAIAGSAVFFILAPGIVAGLVPWMLTGWRGPPVAPGYRLIGMLLVLAGLVVLVDAIARFALVAPTERLVIGGAYRFVRNPMYVAVLSILVGQALLFAEWRLAAYAGFVVAFVRHYEEPTLARRYGVEYEAYRRAVPGWLPRLTPWRGE
ncbi:MAG: isoprenylcysteine carboxylmethyltransferase family protein [Pseudaminobacter sp.]|nr:isoprenylcysteine carboxylmethyltransferase family protein [Pseudaminobacter sp.]